MRAAFLLVGVTLIALTLLQMLRGSLPLSDGGQALVVIAGALLLLHWVDRGPRR